MSRTLPVLISGLLVLAGIAASLYALHATVDAGVGTGIGALLFIVVAAGDPGVTSANRLGPPSGERMADRVTRSDAYNCDPVRGVELPALPRRLPPG
jgi:hypothetical protein